MGVYSRQILLYGYEIGFDQYKEFDDDMLEGYSMKSNSPMLQLQQVVR